MGYVPPVKDSTTVQYENRIPIEKEAAIKRKDPVPKITFLNVTKDGEEQSSLLAIKKQIERKHTNKGLFFDQSV
ncbi:hypothetical protein [Alkalihalobacillus sp. LMS39]|uniref:hypothetical protein n=1 Tax=Alkalihalobacillus sp. LMS39 TaxID=2924032 RepID=UPI001FB4FA52|nr:hypothetical protein [Alkalihalobacillus sp. LMS39]UOE93128.1 hypothetical protein MM271_18220 [Alkalihalobacillus sp. LMS39]